MGVFIFLFFIGMSFSKAGKRDRAEIFVIENEMAEIKKEEIKEVIIPEKKEEARASQEVKQKEFTQPKITPDYLMDKNDKILTLTDDDVIGTQTIESPNTIKIINVPVRDTGVTLLAKLENPGITKEPEIFLKVENDASFPGGLGAWRRFVERTVDSQTPVEGGAAPGTYTVIVKFIVSSTGDVSNVQAETNHGFGMENEAVRAIQKGPKWIPALQNGKNVSAYRRQPITFLIPE